MSGGGVEMANKQKRETYQTRMARTSFLTDERNVFELEQQLAQYRTELKPYKKNKKKETPDDKVKREELERLIGDMNTLIKRKEIIFFSAQISCIDKVKIWFFAKLRDFLDRFVLDPLKSAFPLIGCVFDLFRYWSYVADCVEFNGKLRAIKIRDKKLLFHMSFCDFACFQQFQGAKSLLILGLDSPQMFGLIRTDACIRPVAEAALCIQDPMDYFDRKIQWRESKVVTTDPETKKKTTTWEETTMPEFTYFAHVVPTMGVCWWVKSLFMLIITLGCYASTMWYEQRLKTLEKTRFGRFKLKLKESYVKPSIWKHMCVKSDKLLKELDMHLIVTVVTQEQLATEAEEMIDSKVLSEEAATKVRRESVQIAAAAKAEEDAEIAAEDAAIMENGGKPGEIANPLTN